MAGNIMSIIKNKFGTVDSKDVYEYICSGEFLVTVYKDDEPIDMCKALFRPGLWTEFTIPMR